MRFAPYLIGLGLAALAPFACSSTPATTTAVVRPQLVAVDPSDFLGNVRCEAPPATAGAGGGNAGGAGGISGSGGAGGAAVPRDPDAVHSYVATLFDVTPDADGGVPNPGVPLASSAPTSCIQPVTFSLVVENHRYVAEIDAYHEEPNELSPISAGSRLMKTGDGTRALPGWDTVVCGGYAPSPSDGGAGTAGISGTGGDTSAALSGSGGVGGSRPPGVISYVAITQTPHDCGIGLQAP